MANPLSSSKKESQTLFDFFKMLPKGGFSHSLSDKEAFALFSIWKGTPPGQKTLTASANYKDNIIGLKSKGFVSGFGDSMELTDKGRKAIVEMVTNECNAFLKKDPIPPYSEIKNKTASRPRQSFIKKAKKEIIPYNLKRIEEEKNDNKNNG